MSYSTTENATSSRMLATMQADAADYTRALERAELHIRTAFLSYFAGDGKAVVERVIQRRCMPQYVFDAVDDAAGYEDTLEAYRNLLIGVGTLDEYREALIARYIRMHADDLAEAWSRA